jgi:hypothetical protein
MLPEQGEFAYMATQEALKQAGIDHDFLHKEKSELFMATIVQLSP